LNISRKNILNGYILAGGKSSRMGADKGLILLKGKPIIQHIIKEMVPLVNRLVIVANQPGYGQFGFEVIPDTIPGIGPAGGICAALEHSDAETNFIMGCDMPFISSAAIEYIIQNLAESEVCLTEHSGRLEPLFGVYRKSCLPQWHVLIQQGFLKLHEMVACFHLLKLDVGGNPLFEDPLFLNINTKEDLEKAQSKRNYDQ